MSNFVRCVQLCPFVKLLNCVHYFKLLILFNFANFVSLCPILSILFNLSNSVYLSNSVQFVQFDKLFFFFQNYLRVIYKGYGKTPKDASSVRATHFIPASCGLYYYEVKIISKGRDGYMGIGLSMQQVSTNRLPGWDKLSYGYHGDDGNAFCGSGTGTVSSSLSNNPDF